MSSENLKKLNLFLTMTNRRFKIGLLKINKYAEYLRN